MRALRKRQKPPLIKICSVSSPSQSSWIPSYPLPYFSAHAKWLWKFGACCEVICAPSMKKSPLQKAVAFALLKRKIITFTEWKFVWRLGKFRNCGVFPQRLRFPWRLSHTSDFSETRVRIFKREGGRTMQILHCWGAWGRRGDKVAEVQSQSERGSCVLRTVQCKFGHKVWMAALRWTEKSLKVSEFDRRAGVVLFFCLV